MKNRLWIAITIIVLAMVGLLWFVNKKDSETPKPDFYFSLNLNKTERNIYFAEQPSLNQVGMERKFIIKKAKKIMEIGGVNDTLFYYPVSIKVDNDGYFYVLDINDKCVKKFSSKGIFEKKYGRDGKGPGEFKQPIRFYLDDQKIIYVYDGDLEILTAFSNKVKQLTFNGAISPTEFCPLDTNNIIVLKYSTNSFDILEKYNINGEKIAEFKSILDYRSKTKDFKYLGHIFMGDIVKLSQTRFVHIPQCFNMLFYYKDNKLEKVVTTIDKILHPVLNMEFGSGFFNIPYRSLDEYKINRSAYVVGNDILILNQKASNKKYKVIDVYDKNSGTYKHSIQLYGVGKIYDMEMTKDKIYVISDDLKVKIFSYE
ncbi:MAG: hypothetical protein COW85_04100 [Ignavibacteria bacterium CG22_combo_CG10-13_8_21_14_all_37_15]|nr:MAG: hypothetical protein COW85_04100 [Ignavibacteria bacterium CG22_combo_CG10-13_8_21_14_all_37_15]PIQ08948.1 MAG: hypothetical protein COW71_09095 [Ignavibacteriales bacterium CG18_big_fil_WC_8_21_14_2_50_31_20]